MLQHKGDDKTIDKYLQNGYQSNTASYNSSLMSNKFGMQRSNM